MDDDLASAYELVYLKAVRALSVRRDALESLRTRAGVVLSGAAIETDIEVSDPLPLELIRRDLALQMEAAYRENTELYERLARSFRVAAVLLNIEVLAWVIDLATRA